MKPELIAVSALLLCLAATASFGASPPSAIFEGWTQPGPPPLERFVKPLDLTAEQQQKLGPIFAEAQAKALREESARKKDRRENPEITGAKLASREVDFRVLLASVLRPEQMGQYERLTAERAANVRSLNPHPAHGHGEMSTAPPALEPSAAPAPPAK